MVPEWEATDQGMSKMVPLGRNQNVVTQACGCSFWCNEAVVSQAVERSEADNVKV